MKRKPKKKAKSSEILTRREIKLEEREEAEDIELRKEEDKIVR